ncbi:peptidoglycan-binding protein [Nostocoides sp. F2B08]|uniref:peptidoglycan-binding domain-containing protein n=1 Tax=Nostocoides sp. F2B08 TaxID=2653936 RepID=UPI001263358B|nr:peptidoglycan-binding domain-containing protein [Tetrasphaera sp. F2B08]KAB7744256.1 peptidoglycan-binding protein [Tetrasphaera sp. F2B08]
MQASLRFRRRRSVPVVLAIVGLALAGCSGDEEAAPTPLEAAQAEVTRAEEALAEAQSAATEAEAEFCTASEDYILAIDRYGDVLSDTAPTVGDVREAGADLEAPREEVQQAADEVTATRESVATAEEELAATQAALAEASASAAGTTVPPQTATAEPSAQVEPPPSVARVEQAEAEFAAAVEGIGDRTPLSEASEQFNAAAVALEIAWLRLFADSGCLSEDQEQEAATAVTAYTTSLQQALADLGYLEGEVDGVYGPQTVAAVEALQEANDLPQTGTVDKATAEALQAELAALGGAAAAEETASTAALQQTLTLAGYWDGPVDGQWSDALTEALQEAQEDLGVEPTGTVDAATVAAFERALAEPDDATATDSPTATPTETTSPEPSPTS